MILFKNCRLIPELTEEVSFDLEQLADVWVSDAYVIERIEVTGTSEPGNARVVDAEGGTLLPGFFDLHAHLCLADLDFKQMRNRSCEDSCFEMYDFARN